MIAWLGDRRAHPQPIVDRVELRLGPTSRIEGKVDLRATPSSGVTVMVIGQDQPPQLPYAVLAAVHADGRFEVDGAPRGKVQISTGVSSSLTPSATERVLELHDPVHRGVALQIPQAARQISMLVRSTLGTPLQNAQVFLIGGSVSSMSFLEFAALPTTTRISGLAQPLTDALRTPAIQAVARSGDLLARLGAPDGEATACATALPDDFGDPDLRRKLDANLDKLMLTCVPITADGIVTIEVAPFPRLD